MTLHAIAILLGLVIISVPIAAVIGWLGIFMANFHSFMPLHYAIGDIFWQNSIEFLLVAIPMFILMGEILLRSGITERMYEGMVQWLGWPLLAPALIILSAGIALRIVAGWPWENIAPMNGIVAGSWYGAEIAEEIAAVVKAAVKAAARGFLTTSGIAVGISLGLIIWSYSIQADDE